MKALFISIEFAMAKTFNSAFIPLQIGVLTVSDSRDESTDSSGQLLVDRLTQAGHQLAEKTIVKDDVYKIRAIIANWIASDHIQAVLVTGGTGFTGRDSTPEAVLPLFDKTVDGFGELFRQISHEQIGTSTIQSRAVAGLANGTIVFCMPGSGNACATAWDEIIQSQLTSTHKPCNFVLQLKNTNDDQCGSRG